MGRVSRSETFSNDEVVVVHCIQRCVRQAYLCGVDHATAKNYDHRKEWIRRRIELLSAVFSIDVLNYAILSNHMHVQLRARPDLVSALSDREIALRWLQAFPGRQIEDSLANPTESDIEKLLAQKDHVTKIRGRLSDISWFMRAWCEPIARKANREEGKTGRFFEGRFKAQRIVDEAGLVACSVYIELNQVRASMADSIEESQYSSGNDRLRGANGETMVSAASEFVAEPIGRKEAGERMREKVASGATIDKRKARAYRRQKASGNVVRIRRDGWLAPVELKDGHRKPKDALRSALDEGLDPASKMRIRASDMGFLPMTWDEYYALLVWTGKQPRVGKAGKIPEQLEPLFGRLNLDGEFWCDVVQNFGKYFRRSRCAGLPENMRRHASDHGLRQARGCRAMARCAKAT
jgi:hypothetical protein